MVHPDCADGPGKYEDEDTFREIKKNTAFELLSHSQRREIFHYFNQESEIAYLDDLAGYIYKREIEAGKSTSHAEILTGLHHHHLPKLDAADCIQYDEEARLAKYNGSDIIETLLSALDD